MTLIPLATERKKGKKERQIKTYENQTLLADNSPVQVFFFYSNKHESEKALFLAVVAILVSIKLTDVKALTAERVAATAKRVNFILIIDLIY